MLEDHQRTLYGNGKERQGLAYRQERLEQAFANANDKRKVWLVFAASLLGSAAAIAIAVLK
jgi:hypothetical protein